MNNIININELEKIKSVGLNGQMSQTDFIEYKEKIEKSSILLNESLINFSNNSNQENLKLLLENYKIYKENINEFYNSGGLNEINKENIKFGFSLNVNDKSVNGMFAIEKLISSIEIYDEKNVEYDENTRLKVSQAIDGSGLFDWDTETYLRTSKFELKNLSGKYLENQVYLLNDDIKNLVIDSGIDYSKISSQSLFCLYNYGLIEAIRNVDNKNSEEYKKSISTINKVLSEEIINISEDKNKNYSLRLENGELNHDFKKYYDLMKEEKNTFWLKDNIVDFNKEDLEKVGVIENPVIDFANEIFKEQSIDNKKFDLEMATDLTTSIFSDEKVKSYFTKEDILKYLEQDFPNPAIVNSMFLSLDNNDLNQEYDKKYTFVEKVLSVLIGEDSNVFATNENKLACVANLINHPDFDIEKPLVISTSKNLNNLYLNNHENLFDNENNEHKVKFSKQQQLVNDSIPNQLIFDKNNKINLLDFLTQAKDHLIIQNMSSDISNHQRHNKIFDEKEGFLIKSVKKDWFDLMKGTMPNEDFPATKFKQKVMNVSNYFNNMNGPISSFIGFTGVLCCAIFVAGAKMIENRQNDRIKEHLNSFSSHKLKIENIKTKFNDHGDIEFLAVVNKEEISIATGKDSETLKSNDNRMFQTVKVAENEIVEKLTSHLKSEELKQEISSAIVEGSTISQTILKFKNKVKENTINKNQNLSQQNNEHLIAI